MTQPQIRLRKSWPPKQDIDDDGSVLERWSANWEILDYPGLFLARRRDSGTQRPYWSFSCNAAYLPTEKQPQEFERAIGLFPLLQGQLFITRREALQALRASEVVLKSKVD